MLTNAMKDYLRNMVDSYLETALWAETNSDDYPDDNCPPPWDDDYDISDFSEGARLKAEQDCYDLVQCLENVDVDEDTSLYDWILEDKDGGNIGHDFWLTRNGHGAGFWDGDYGEFGDLITQIVNDNFSEAYIYAVGDGTLELQ